MAAEPTPVRLIVGLGNPGPEYRETRHNAGFWFVDNLMTRYPCDPLRMDTRYQSEIGRITVDGQPVWVMKPQTFMNRSGGPIGRFAGFYKLPRSAVLVAYDELDLPVGVPRLKRDGGPGGHNGVKDTIAHLGGRDFQRLRIGIGHPGDARQVVDYVLRKPPAAEREAILAAIDDAERVVPLLVAGDLEAAMRHLHAPR